jgi:hypothetical protein
MAQNKKEGMKDFLSKEDPAIEKLKRKYLNDSQAPTKLDLGS